MCGAWFCRSRSLSAIFLVFQSAFAADLGLSGWWRRREFQYPFEHVREGRKLRNPRDHGMQPGQCDGDVHKEIIPVSLVPEETVRPERLHEALSGAKIIDSTKGTGSGEGRMIRCNALVEFEEMLLFVAGKVHIRVKKHRSQVVLRKSWAHSLKINQAGFSVENHHILRLKITVHQHSWNRGELSGDRLQCGL